MQAKRIRAQRWQPPSDELVVAAVDRAHRHRHRRDAGATLSDIAGHLGIPLGPVASRRLRPIIDRLTNERRWLAHSRRQSRDHWALTDAGVERLSRALIEGIAEELPESPQHREWRAAREHAAARIDVLQSELSELLAKLDALLDAEDPPPTSDWLSLAKPLQDLTMAVGVAHYCLYERPEPDDARADRDDLTEPAGSPVSWRHPRIWDPGHGD